MFQVVDLGVSSFASVRVDFEEEGVTVFDFTEKREFRLISANGTNSAKKIKLLRFNDSASFAMVSGRNGLPLFGQCHNGASIKHTETKQMIEFQPNAIHRPMETIFRIEKRVSFRCEHRQMLNITPRQVRAEKLSGKQ